MTKQESVPPRYWIFKDSYQNYFSGPEPDRSTPPVSELKLWFLEFELEVRPEDVVYFYRQEDSSYFYGWGMIASETASVAPDIAASSSPYRFAVQLSYHLFFSHLVMRADLDKEPALKDLSELTEPQTEVIQINNEQATALNRLIRARGAEPPPDPILEEATDTSAQGDGDKEKPKRTSLAELLNRLSGDLSPLCERILKRAGEFATTRQRNANQITTSCLLFAVIEEGGHSSGGEIETASQFVLRWMDEDDFRTTQYERALATFLGTAVKRRRGSPLLTPNSIKVIDRAATIANFVRQKNKTSNPGVIHARDLLGALLFTMTKNRRLGAATRLSGMDISVESLQTAFFEQFLNSEKNSDDDIDKWREVLIDGRLPEEQPDTKPSLPNIDADTPSLKDDLNIGPEVQGFANIIAARDVKTPLSIGIFGDWGSGKSTFMEQLQVAVDDIGKSVRNKKEDEKTAFLGNIVQIKFNAWHYAEANLWASLVSHVFENLSFSEEEEKDKAEKRKQLFLNKLVTTLATKKAAEAVVKIKEKNFKDAKTALDDAQRDQENAQIKLRHVLAQGVWPLVNKFLSQDPDAQQKLSEARRVLDKAGLNDEELKQEIEASRTTLGRLQLHLTSFATDPHGAFRIAGLVILIVLIPLVLTFIVSRLGDSGVWERFITGVAPILTLIAGALTWIRSNRKTVDSMLGTLRVAEQKLDDLYASARAEYDDTVKSLGQEVVEKQAELITAKKAVEEATRERTETLAALREMEPGRLLETFVQERAASTDYRKLLGVVALIRRDFKRLSDMMRQQGNVELRQAVAEILERDDPENQLVEETLKEYRIDRIVLYIDDLDRCPPKQVVDVLQAIHLLLAFELFVVVVGVDARWIRHALRERYRAMLSEDWIDTAGTKSDDDGIVNMATPRDYVEKIFQIPFWLKPLDDVASLQLLKGLIPDSQLLDSKTNGKGNVTGQTGTAKDRQSTGGTTSRKSELAARDTTDTGKTEKNGLTGVATGIDGGNSSDLKDEHRDEVIKKRGPFLDPASLLLDVKERDAMIALSRVIGRTPRTLKRFVNIYRIIKAGLDREQLKAFVGSGRSDPQYRGVLALLAIAHGAPDLAPTFFSALKTAPNRLFEGKKIVGFKTFLNSATSPDVLATVDRTMQPAWKCLIVDLSEFANGYQNDISLSVLYEWLPVVVRYTFQLGRLSEAVANNTAREVGVKK